MQTTETMERLIAPEHYSPQCPDWCTLTGYDHEEATCVITEGGVRRPVVDHLGPTFGPINISAAEYLLTEEPLKIRAHVEGEFVMDADALHAFAADVLAADEWLEAHS